MKARRSPCAVIVIRIALALVASVLAASPALAQTLSTFNTLAGYNAALPAAGVETSVEDFSSVTFDRAVSTGTPDVWRGFTLLATGTSPFGSSIYCVSLRGCMNWTPSPPTLPGIYGAVGGSQSGNGRLTFTLNPRAVAFALEYWDWNDGGQRSAITVTLSNGATFNVTGPTTTAGDPGGFVGFRIDQASINAGITITSVAWVVLPPGSEIIGMRNVRVTTRNPLVVLNTADSGIGSLRDAVQFANSRTGPSTISFAIPGAGPHTITLSSVLPDIAANGLTVDGSTQPGTQCRDLWAGSGHDLRINLRGSSGFDGLRLAGANQTIRGLSITGFSDGVELLPASNAAALHCNYIGLLPNGGSSGNASRAIVVAGASARLGGLGTGEGNIVSANGFGIITLAGSSDTAIRGNFVGTDAAGMTARANGNGINNFNGSATWRDITYNLISGNNGTAGIALDTDDRITASDGQVRIQRNIIGFTRTLSALLANGGDGIFFDSSSITNVLIGGVSANEGNVITGNQDAIDLRAVTNIRIRGNRIARAPARGIWLAGASTITIGGTAAGEGNSIGGNGADGIYVGGNASAITILGNLIQPLTIAGSTLANSGHGVWLDGTSNVMIGDGTAAGRNLIGGNLRRGIQGSATNAGITINGNYIGTDATGNVAVANGQNEGSLAKDAISFDNGGTFTNLAILNNVIGGYEAALIEAWNSTGNGLTIQGNNIGVGANGTSQIVANNVEDLIFTGGGGTYSNVMIGGSAAGQGNIIGFSNRSGVRLESGGTNIQVIGNTIRNNTRNGIYLLGSTRAAIIGNRISANGLTGIDLGENGVTANDPGDGDSGANDLLNFPQITRAVVTAANQLRYNFTLDAPAAATGYRVEFFANAAADPSGFGEGERLLGAIDIAHAGGARSFSGTLTTAEPVAIGDSITATTSRRTAGGAWDISSEFSAFAAADGVAQIGVAITSSLFAPPADNPYATPGNDIRLTATFTNTGTGSTDSNSVFAVLAIRPGLSFFNAATPEFGGVAGFTTTAPALTFTPATDLRFSNTVAAPASFAQCTYTPVAGYDPAVRHVCLNPKGALPPGSSQREFTVSLRARIN